PPPHRLLPSFPTRRSSDLASAQVGRSLPDQVTFASPPLLQNTVFSSPGATYRAPDAAMLCTSMRLSPSTTTSRSCPIVRTSMGRDRKSTRLNSSHVKISYA